MGFREEIQVYKDKNGYVNPFPANPSLGRQCDNATMFTSEAAIILQKLNQSTIADKDQWEILINNSMIVPGLTVRYPGDTSLDAPDNIVAILSASKVLGKPQVAYSLLQYGIGNFGFFNTTNPNHVKNTDGSWNWPALQWRQPQLAFAAYTASDSYRWWKFWLWPLMVITGLIIGTSCIKVSTSDTDSRRLAWHLIQATQEDSWFCRQMAKIWYKRLYSDYGPTGMQAVASQYYQPHPINPFSEYWVN